MNQVIINGYYRVLSPLCYPEITGKTAEQRDVAQ
jgi:hypothetical protein